MHTPLPVPDRKNYDLFFRMGKAKLSWRNAKPGITLTDDAIGWAAGDRQQEARLSDIARVHLQTGSIGQNTIASCRLGLRDGPTLLIASNNGHGLQDTVHDKLYAEFVQDLHARLAALRDSRIAFTAGFSAARYRLVTVTIVVAGLLFLVAPAALLVVTGSWQMVWALVVGAGLLWPLYRVMRANAPRSYDPRQIPRELLPSASDLG
jgi:hypothetical protein